MLVRVRRSKNDKIKSKAGIRTQVLRENKKKKLAR